MSSTLFLLLILATLGLLTTVYVIWPLLRRPAADDAGGEAGQLNREIVRERRAQLDRELAQLPPGSVDQDRLILEFSSAAMTDLAPERPGMIRRTTSQRWVTAALLAGLLVAGPLVFYALVGEPGAASPDFARQALPQGQPQQFEALVAELEKRLQADPEAADAWLLLGRSKMSLGDLPGATAALERALGLDSAVPGLAAQIRVDLADAIAQGAAARLSGRPWDLIQEALKLDAGNQKALALAGAYQVTQGNPAGALSYWEPLLAQLPAASEQHAQIASFIGEIKAGRNPGAGPAPAVAPTAGPTAAPTVAPAAVPDAIPGTGPVLRGRLELDGSLAGNARPSDTVFVAVRALDPQDHPAGPPVAVLRARVADLPLDFELSDRQAMSPTSRLSGQDRVIVVGRVSRAGTAATSPGDLEGRSPIVAPDAQGVQVRIDRVVP